MSSVPTLVRPDGRRVRPVRGEVPGLPGQAVRTRVRPVRPEVGRPRDPRPGAGRVVEIARPRVRRAAAHLIDLRLDHPLRRESGLVGVRLRVQGRGGIAGIDAARQVDLLQVRVTHLQGADDVAGLGDEAIGIRARGGQGHGWPGVSDLHPRDLHLRLRQPPRREPRVADPVVVEVGGGVPGVGGLAARGSVDDGERAVVDRGVRRGLGHEGSGAAGCGAAELLGGIRHPDGHQHVLAAGVGIAGRVARDDAASLVDPRRLVVGGHFVERVRVQASGEALVRPGHVGQRHGKASEARRRGQSRDGQDARKR